MMTTFDRAPFIVIWETTRACALACVHCRAEAMPHRDAGELTTEEACDLLDRVAAFGDPPPLVVFTGGDPLRRPDLEELVMYGTARGLSIAVTPSGTAAATTARLTALRDGGLARLAVSLDGAEAAAHDAFRGVQGSYKRTLGIIERARALNLPLQVNTTVSRRTVADLPAIADQVERFGAVLWALFFLIPVGRATADDALDAAEIERVLEWAAGRAAGASFIVKTTEAPHYHRVLARRGDRPRPGPRPNAPRAPRAVTDGNGFVFIDHVGNICPSGFLPVPRGNVRGDDLVAVYRDDPLFQALRNPDRLRGRCGACEYRTTCGGSRARAWAATGDPFAEDPGCAWQPNETGPLAIAGGSDAVTVVREVDVRTALSTVIDPELAMSIVDLGLIYDIRIDGAHVAITMTLTAPGCPLHDTIVDWARAAVSALPDVERVDITLTFDPPWTPSRVRNSR
jgi:MoaA/NifB/PqqE/SkfB family radical SAM enzyme/metal-sulfur cluster biosynthetic enzyme